MSAKPRNFPTRLDPSQLGTKEYWDNLYRTDLETHAQTPDHIGQVWFDESGAEDRTITFLEDHDDLGIDPASTKVLDLGTGNASMLIKLREEGWDGDLWGVDYSATSVQLARRLVGEWAHATLSQGQDRENEDEPGATSEVGRFDNLEMPAPGIYIITHDVLSHWPPSTAHQLTPPSQFDLVHDKGTFDAISLSHTATEACPLYRTRVQELTRPGGLLLITSCNWTEEELDQWITGDERSLFQRIGRIGYSQFQFGGQKGSVLSGLCWRRRTNE